MLVFDERLKPCPIKSCGGSAYYEEKTYGDCVTEIVVGCAKCGLRGHKAHLTKSSQKDYIKSVIDYWNDR